MVRNADAKTMNPQIMIARLQRFQQLDRVKHEHDVFLRSLNPPINILPGKLPQPPNIEKFSSVKDELTAKFTVPLMKID